MTHDFHFDLFVSYATDPDYRLVRSVEGRLESFHASSWAEALGLRKLRICVDGSDFKLAHSMDDAYLDRVRPVLDYYLASSRYLLVCCSRNARVSAWVHYEVDWFLANRGAQAVILAITEGVDPSAHPEEVFDARVIDAGIHRKPWYDFRGFEGRGSRWRKVRDFEDAWLSLAAHLCNLSLADVSPLWLRDKKRVELTRRLTDYSGQVVRSVGVWSAEPVACLEGLSRCEGDLRDFTWALFAKAGERLRRFAPAPSFAACAVAVHDETSRYAVGGGDFQNGTVLHVGDLSGFQSLQKLVRHQARVTALTFTINGQTLISAGMDGLVIFWSVASGRPIHELRAGAGVMSLALSNDEHWLGLGTDNGKVILWKVGQAHPSQQFHVEKPVLDTSFSPNRRTLAAAVGHEVHLWDTETGRKLGKLVGHTSFVWAVAFSPLGNPIVTGCSDHTLRGWDAVTMTQLWVARDPADGVTSIVFSPDASMFAAGTRDGLVTLRSPASGTRLSALRGHDVDVFDVAFSKDGRTLISGGGKKLTDPGQVILWRPPAPPVSSEFSDYQTSVDCVALSPRNMVVAAGGVNTLAGIQDILNLDGELKLWDLGTGERLADLTADGFEPSALAFSPDGSALVSGHGPTIRSWDMSQSRPTSREVALLEGDVHSLVFSPSGDILAVGTSRSVALLAAQDFREITRINVGGLALAVSRDGAMLACGDAGGEVVLWDIRLCRAIATLGAHAWPITSVAFSPDNELVASSAGYELDGKSGSLLISQVADSSSRQLLGHTGPVFSVTFSPDGRTVVSGGEDRVLRLWEPCTGHQLASLSGHNFPIRAAVFAGEGKLLVSSGGSGHVGGELRLWTAVDADWRGATLL